MTNTTMVSTAKDFQQNMTEFIQNQLQSNPENIEQTIDTVCNHDEQLKTIAKTILSIERCKMMQNKSTR